MYGIDVLNTILTKVTAVCIFHFNNPSADDANV